MMRILESTFAMLLGILFSLVSNAECLASEWKFENVLHGSLNLSDTVEVVDGIELRNWNYHDLAIDVSETVPNQFSILVFQQNNYDGNFESSPNLFIASLILPANATISSVQVGAATGWNADSLTFTDKSFTWDIGGQQIGVGSIRFDVQTVPEPSAFAILSVGTLGLVGYTWRRRFSA